MALNDSRQHIATSIDVGVGLVRVVSITGIEFEFSGRHRVVRGDREVVHDQESLGFLGGPVEPLDAKWKEIEFSVLGQNDSDMIGEFWGHGRLN